MIKGTRDSWEKCPSRQGSVDNVRLLSPYFSSSILRTEMKSREISHTISSNIDNLRLFFALLDVQEDQGLFVV